MESLLLLFTSLLPCWDEETVTVAGENPDSLHALAESGDITAISGGYVLTQKGIITRENAARELFLPLTPAGEIITDPELPANFLSLTA